MEIFPLFNHSELEDRLLCIETLSLQELAWLTHEAEFLDSDVLMMEIADEVLKRKDKSLFRELYCQCWEQHAYDRGYH